MGTCLRILLAAALSANLPAAAPKPVEGVPGAFTLKENGGWCWYQGPRAIMAANDRVLFTTIAGDSHGGADAGDLWATSWCYRTGKLEHFELHDKFQRDDHNVAGLHQRVDGRILAVYGKHGGDQLQRWRITTRADGISDWSQEQTLDVGARYTYSNVFQLTEESNRVYNFSRTRGYNPNCTISDDDGATWRYGWRLLSRVAGDYRKDPRHTGQDGSRPYLRYASNGRDTIHFVSSDDHPRAYDNSIYHGFYRKGTLFDSSGRELGKPGTDGTSPLKPNSFTEVFRGGPDRVAWTVDLELDSKGLPYTVFSVQVDGAQVRTQRNTANGCADHRYWYARFDGKEWQTHEMAFAGTRLYVGEDDYTGLAALDPQDPNTVIISTNADPSSGRPLVSSTDNKRHWELFRGTTTDRGATWTWTALTHNSTVDNLRPLIPAGPAEKRIILWCRGSLRTFTDYRLDLTGMVERR